MVREWGSLLCLDEVSMLKNALLLLLFFGGGGGREWGRAKALYFSIYISPQVLSPLEIQPTASLLDEDFVASLGTSTEVFH